MPRPLGFSTGSLAAGDYKAALEALRLSNATAIELSALREHELEPLMKELPNLDLGKFDHVSIHAPSSLSLYSEEDVVKLLAPAIELSYPIIVHADVIKTPSVWGKLGANLAIENMDKRKSTGRTAHELRPLFASFPKKQKARLCLDLGHARQVDPSLCESVALLLEFGDRIVQFHLSELNSQSRHEALSFGAVSAMRMLTNLFPSDVPIILEFAADPHELDVHLEFVESMLRPSLQMIRDVG